MNTAAMVDCGIVGHVVDKRKHIGSFFVPRYLIFFEVRSSDYFEHSPDERCSCANKG